MSDEIKGTAVLKRDPDGKEWLHVAALPTAGPRAGHLMNLRLPAYSQGHPKPDTHNGAAWCYVVARPVMFGCVGRINVTPSVLCSESKWSEERGCFTDEKVQTFHNGFSWSVDYVECPADKGAYERLCELNPELGR
jgi:hypothetical protein